MKPNYITAYFGWFLQIKVFCGHLLMMCDLH